MTKRNLLITSAIISLSLLNVNNVQAENETGDSEEDQAVIVEEVNTNSENHMSSQSEDESVLKNNDIEKQFNDSQQKFNQIFQKLYSLVNENQKQILEDIISTEDEATILFREAIIAHEDNDFDLATEKYNRFLTDGRETTDEIVGFVQLVKKLGYEKINILDYEYSNKQSSTKTEIETEDSSDKSPATDEENIEDAITAEELELQKQEEEKQQNLAAQSHVVNANNQSRDDYFNQIINSKQVSHSWTLAQEFKSKFPEDDRVQDAIDYAAQMHLDYAMKIHGEGRHQAATMYYNRLLNEELVSSEIKSSIQIYSQQAQQGQQLITSDDYYNEIMSSKSVSEAWNLAQEYKILFADDNRSLEVMNHAAQMHLDYALKIHSEGRHQAAILYYDRLLNEESISSSIKEFAQIYNNYAQSNKLPLNANEYYTQIISSKSVSEAWNLAQEYKKIYPNENSMTEAMIHAGQMHFDYAMKIHSQGRYEAATLYYSRILNEEILDTKFHSESKLYKQQSENDKDLTTTDDYIDQIMESGSVSEVWNLTQEFKKMFPNENRVNEVMNYAAQNHLDYAMKIHDQGRYEAASMYYSRVINEDLTSLEIKSEAKVYNQQSKQQQELMTSNELYKNVMESKQVSEAWNLAQEFKDVFRSDSRIKEVINHAGQMHFDYAMKIHDQGRYEAATKYYSRIINEEQVDSRIKSEANVYNSQAKNNQNLTTADDYYKKVMKSTQVSETWSLAQEYKNTFPNDNRVQISIDYAAEMHLNYAMKIHNQGRYEAASMYYSRIFNEEMTTNSLKTKAESYKYLADNNYSLSSLIFRDTYYNIKLDDFISEQMKHNPQIWDTSTGNSPWRDANKNEVTRYIDPANVKQNTDFLQFLMLSGSSGVSVNDLNKELENAGILRGLGSTFQKASLEANINELYLIAHALLETGNGTSKLATGIEINGQTVYNMFGIGARDSNPNKLGAEKAYELGWFTPEKAIIGGAQWISSSYINSPTYKQNTLYKMRWNPERPGIHQYATDVAWAYNQTSSLFSMVELAQKYDVILNFDIPNFE